MTYLVLVKASETFADEVSRNIWQLARPDAETNPRLVTKRWTGWIVHPKDGRVALQLPDADGLNVNSGASNRDLPDYLAPDIPVTDKEKLSVDITMNRGRTVGVKTLVPFSDFGTITTQAEMEADGWFPDTP